MAARGSMLLLGAALACSGVWWLATRPAAAPVPTAFAATPTASRPRCPLPPRVARGAEPLQTAADGRLALPAVGDSRMTALAGFSIEARVLGREDYRLGREADYSPTDLALGWGRMTDDAVVERLPITQSGRWYRYRWEGDPPIPVDEIVRSSANMHIIPADPAVAATLARVRTGERVRIDGWLVQLDATDGWRWRSSLTRDDSGGGACELVYACAISAP